MRPHVRIKDRGKGKLHLISTVKDYRKQKPLPYIVMLALPTTKYFVALEKTR